MSSQEIQGLLTSEETKRTLAAVWKRVFRNGRQTPEIYEVVINKLKQNDIRRKELYPARDATENDNRRNKILLMLLKYNSFRNLRSCR